MRGSIIICLFFVFSCAGESVPEGVFSKQKMGDVLYDIVLADEWVDYTRLYDSTYINFPKRAAVYDSVFQVHRITKKDYQKSIGYYQSRPDVLKEILESLAAKADTTTGKKIKPVTEKAL